MANKKTTADRLDDVSSRLIALSSIIKLCAFSAEARRVLGDFDSAKSTNPEFNETVMRLIEASSDWAEHEDTLGLVLRNAAYEIDKLQNVIEEVQP